MTGKSSKSKTSNHPLAVVGTVAIDAVETPFGKRDRVFGGSASYFSYVASFFTPVSLVAVVGEDFPEEYRQILAERPIDISHLKTVPGKTFAWSGKYEGDMNSAITLETRLNTLLEFDPKLEYSSYPEFLFLANIDPDLQLKVLGQVKKSKLKYAACDTMNFWIESKRASLLEVMKRVDCMVLNEGETKMLTGESNLIRAGRSIIEMGPRHVLIKKGEHGVLFLSKDHIFALPAFPVEIVRDPTGAGDTFAGGFMGYLASAREVSFSNLKKACAAGTVAASFTVQDFGLDALRGLSLETLMKRLEHFKVLCSF